ncbi:hypothetical protein BJX76DRAFT_301923 [Aspergillus varians]
MSATNTSSAPAATCTGNSWVLPVQDVACGLIKSTNNYSEIMKDCCGDAEVKSYNDDCGLYCLAQGQDGQSLLDCIQDKGATNGDFFCGGNLTHSATAAAPTKTGSNDDDDSNSASATNDADGAANTDNAAVRAPVVNKAGLGVLAMLFCSAVVGVVA